MPASSRPLSDGIGLLRRQGAGIHIVKHQDVQSGQRLAQRGDIVQAQVHLIRLPDSRRQAGHVHRAIG